MLTSASTTRRAAGVNSKSPYQTPVNLRVCDMGPLRVVPSSATGNRRPSKWKRREAERCGWRYWEGRFPVKGRWFAPNQWEHADSPRSVCWHGNSWQIFGTILDDKECQLLQLRRSTISLHVQMMMLFIRGIHKGPMHHRPSA